jgi:hypothetical protein
MSRGLRVFVYGGTEAIILFYLDIQRERGCVALGTGIL